MGSTLGFIHLKEAHYADSALSERSDGLLDEITVGKYDDDGGCRWEFCLCWYDCIGMNSPRLEIYSDAWEAFSECKEMWAFFTEWSEDALSPDFLSRHLRGLGFEDRTPRENPHEKKSTLLEASEAALLVLNDVAAVNGWESKEAKQLREAIAREEENKR